MEETNQAKELNNANIDPPKQKQQRYHEETTSIQKPQLLDHKSQNQLQKEYKAQKKKYNPVKEMPKLNTEPDYIIKTRPPMWDDWRLNIFRGVKENKLKLEANKIARRKCWETGQAMEQCGIDKGMFKVWSCKKEFDGFLNCCYHEQQVELDKMRRDTKKHNEWWWLNIYDESGEIGKQAEWKPEESLKDMWIKNVLYNYMFKPKENKLTEDTRLARLEELRRKQGRDIELVKEEYTFDFHIDDKRATELGNPQHDKTIYNV
eukprot:403351670